MLNAQQLKSPLRFGMKPPEDPSLEPECCKRRKQGLPVDCCPPLPPDQLVKSTETASAGKTIPLNVINNPCPQPKADGQKKHGRLVQLVLNIVQWAKEFVTNLWKDLKQLFTGSK